MLLHESLVFSMARCDCVITITYKITQSTDKFGSCLNKPYRNFRQQQEKSYCKSQTSVNCFTAFSNVVVWKYEIVLT